MKAITTPKEIEKLGTILCVGAHPDDETWIAGGVLAAAAQNGQRVAVLTATKGELGVQDHKQWPAEALAQIRAQELHDSLAILGITEHGWLGCKDGECDCVDCDMMAARLIKHIQAIKPDSIVTFGPEGLTGHADHTAVAEWCSQAVRQCGLPVMLYQAVHTQDWYDRWGKELHERANVFFNIDEPPIVDEQELAICLELTPELADIKYQALVAQASQMKELLAKFEGDKLPEALAQECFVIAE